MGKIKYLIQRVFSMNYKNLFNTINEVHLKTKKNRFLIFVDIIYCGIKYQAGYMDYKLYEMYNLNKKQRKTIVTRGINNALVKKYNNKEYIYLLDNKLEFNKTFNKYLKRDWMEIKEDSSNFEEFTKFIKKHNEIIVKPLSESCGKGVEKIRVSTKNAKEVYDNLLETKRYLVEEVAVQCDEISKLHPSSINTLRLVTLNNKVVVALLRMGNNNNVVDNFNHEGLVAPIDIQTGKIEFPAITKSGLIYEEHPLTNEKIVSFEVPKWNEIINFIEDVSKIVNEVKYVGWDVCLGKNGPFLIEGNPFPGHDLYQLPPHRKNNEGLLPVFINAEKEK